jgi:alkylhydroperoxidase family enzyme
VTLDEELVSALQKDYRSAPVSEQDAAMLNYVVELTKDATRISANDHLRLRSVGFDDRAILQITLIASWFNYIKSRRRCIGSRTGVETG